VRQVVNAPRKNGAIGPRHSSILSDVGKDLLESDYDAIRLRLRKHGLIEKLLYQARRLKTALDQQPDLIESFYQSVQGGCLPSAQLESFPLLCAYSLIQWALEGKTEGDGYGFPFDRPHVWKSSRVMQPCGRNSWFNSTLERNASLHFVAALPDLTFGLDARSSELSFGA
jgi:hypothetical protein